MILSPPQLHEIPSEEKCIQILKEVKEEKGIICKKCGNTQHYWKLDKIVFECKTKDCKRRVSLTVDTIMHRSRLPLHYWVVVMDFRISRSDVTIKEIQAYLHHKRYEPIWDIYNKINNQIKRLKSQDSSKEESRLIDFNELSIEDESFSYLINNSEEYKLNKSSFDKGLIRIYLEWLSQNLKKR